MLLHILLSKGNKLEQLAYLIHRPGGKRIYYFELLKFNIFKHGIKITIESFYLHSLFPRHRPALTLTIKNALRIDDLPILHP